MKKLQKGFTLIELLVVIAIIGILSSIVLASLSSARTKSEDAAITSTLSNMRAQAELLYSNIASYGPAYTAGVCPSIAGNSLFATSTTGSLFTLIQGLNDRAGNTATRCSVETGGGAWAVAATLKGDTAKVACADSTGKSQTKTTSLATSITASACN